ncbi:MAG TPA: RNA 2',3'-cyclic phosphodiesterase [Gemmatimonadaceae bacterium]|nr:RNA 2',3'-cyclic phosphodiesterase [Gemmatimonadaceae bacterium]
MRLFLAINIEPAVRRAIVDATAPLRAAAPSLRWTDDSRLHLTLKFLGEQDESVLPSLCQTMTDVARRHRGFVMRVGGSGGLGGVGGVGAFPNFRRARVVWIGVERDPRLELLHHDVEVACEAHGFEVEGRAFRPHLTLARVNDRADVDEMRTLWRASKRVDFEGESDVQSIDVMKSTAATGGSRYERLHAATLRGH